MKFSILFLFVALLFLSATTKAQSSFDVVYGGTPGGIVAAVAPACSGAGSTGSGR
jgi:hypothetical protein